MDKYQDLTKDIPWKSFGRETVTAKVGNSLVPVGIFPFDLPSLPSSGVPVIEINARNADKYLMNIVGTAIQAGDGKLVTCAHVVTGLVEERSKGYILARISRDGTVIWVPYPVQKALRFVDPRTNKVNMNVDLAVLICAAKSTKELPYEVPNVRWGDSSELGIGDQVVIGGYPYGKEMFLFTKSNRGIVQPTFYSGIVSAILPATNPQETRMIQISIPGAGGMSGGAVFDPKTGEIMGMVTSGAVDSQGIPLPMTYAIPSEIIAPYVKVITFKIG
ncbi:MAG: serine protease [Candidatus Brocadiales bacterium]